MIGLESGIYPPIFHFLREYGIYVFRFYKDGQWLYVITDDLLPCDQTGNLLFASSRYPNRFWAALIEKAYAKLHHNYHNLTNGYPEEALNDLTGLPAKRFRFKAGRPGEAPTLVNFSSKDELWNKLVDSYLKGYMLSCGADSIKKQGTQGKKKTDIIEGHAYSIQAVYELKVA